MTLDELRRVFAVDPTHGLVHETILERRKRYGSNSFSETKKIALWERVLKQLASPLVFILLIAAVITSGLGKHVDTIVITIALLINVIVGTLQEERASRAFEALAKSQSRKAIAIREGKRTKIEAADLVPGDIILLEGGYQVPADARIFEEKDLRINEAVLTGEWLPVEKDTLIPTASVPISEKRNMAWMGTMIESGYGRGMVVSIGDKTEVGKIAASLSEIDESSTPLQINIKKIARFLTIVISVAVVVIFGLGLLRGESPLDIFLLSVAVAVATVPSGLPAAVTVVLALGMEAILKRGGLVRNLLAAETLGATTVILTDKTGTLTEAKMHLRSLHSASSIDRLVLAGDGENTSRIKTPDDRFLLEAAVLSSDAFIDEEAQEPEKIDVAVHGRPIEKAVILAGLEEGVAQSELSVGNKRLDYLRFESSRRFGASLNALPKHKAHRMYLTGAPETLLLKAKYILRDGKRVAKTDVHTADFEKLFLEMSRKGMRLIGASYKDTDWEDLHESDPDPLRNDLTDKSIFIGVMAFEDPVREDVPAAIKEVKGAGVRVIMVTGDNPETARTIAKEAGIIEDDMALVIRGDEIEAASDAELANLMSKVSVVARALPMHKLRIAKVLRERKEVVAMTGDGINDAPALQAASIGIAVESGTEVAKQASDMVLMGNSFSIIVAAIEEGRRIVDNLKKILAYLLSGSFSEIFVIAGALVVGAPLPLLPTQILWTKIVEEGLMSFSFAFEGKDPEAMKRSPREMETKEILTAEIRKLIIAVSLVTGGFLVILYFILLSLSLPIEEIRTIMFAALSMDAIFFTFSLKSFRLPLWKINPFDNRFLLLALLLSFTALGLALFTPFLAGILSLTPLSFSQLLLLVFIGLFNLATIEVAKYFLFRRGKI